jgi:hypothetical protein
MLNFYLIRDLQFQLTALRLSDLIHTIDRDRDIVVGIFKQEIEDIRKELGEEQRERQRLERRVENEQRERRLIDRRVDGELRQRGTESQQLLRSAISSLERLIQQREVEIAVNDVGEQHESASRCLQGILSSLFFPYLPEPPN